MRALVHAGVADTVICVEAIPARDVTAEAHANDARFGAAPALGHGTGERYGPVRERMPISILPGSPSGALSACRSLLCSCSFMSDHNHVVLLLVLYKCVCHASVFLRKEQSDVRR